MKLKSYFSSSVQAAMELARTELGEEALLIHARPTTPETRHLGAFEVVFGSGLAAGPVKLAEPPRAALSEELAGVKREIELLSRSLRNVRSMIHPADSSGLYDQLIASELDPELAARVREGTSLDQLFETDATLGRPGVGRNIVALVGPPGFGKTTTLGKLAVHFGLAARTPAHIITADVFRIGAVDQIRSLAAIIGIGCDVADTPAALAQMIEHHRSKELIFIDTPGLTAAEMEDGAELAHVMASNPDIDIHLVLPASMKSSDLSRAIDRFEIFQPKKLLFTHIDETQQFGAIVNEAARRSLPVSFLCTGQQTPDDIEPATKERITALILGSGYQNKSSQGVGA